MKITVGGSMGFKKQGKPYESIDANTFFTIEKEVPDDWPKEKLEELFNKTNDIIEIKLSSETIINRDGTISAHVIQAVDQIIEYMESSQAVAHSSVLSNEEGIKELRPRGIVIIGIDKSPEAQRKLHKWNYQFAHINILTYEDVLDRAESILQHLKNK